MSADVLVAVDQPLLRSALAHVLARNQGLRIISCSPAEIPERCADLEPDIVVASRDVAAPGLLLLVSIDSGECWLRSPSGQWLPRAYPGINRLGRLIVDEVAGRKVIAG